MLSWRERFPREYDREGGEQDEKHWKKMGQTAGRAVAGADGGLHRGGDARIGGNVHSKPDTAAKRRSACQRGDRHRRNFC